MASYKLLALDMDGTLLDSHKQVLPKTAEAITRLAARGTAVAYSTGRNPVELGDYTSQLPAIKYGSCISGGLVYDFSQGKTIFVRPFATDLALEVLGIASDEHPMVHMLCTNASVVRQDDIDHMDDFHMSIYHGMFERLCTRTSNPADFVRAHEGEICKINLYHRDPEARDRTRARLEAANLPLQLADAEVTSLECSPAGVSKAEGLSKLCEYLGITLDEVVSVGDAPNDTQALKAAGLAVAMGNATPEIKQLADVVVADNDHNGIVEVIDRFF